jgi:hypothetical protein
MDGADMLNFAAWSIAPCTALLTILLVLATVILVFSKSVSCLLVVHHM